MKFLKRIQIILIIFLLLNSCSIEKRLYNKGYNIQFSHFSLKSKSVSETEFDSSTSFIESNKKQIKPDLIIDTFKSKDTLVLIDSSNKYIQLKTKEISFKIRKTLNNKIEDKNFTYIPNRFHSKIKNNKIELKTTSRKIDSSDILDFFGWLLGLILVLGLLFLFGLAFKILFPALPWLLAILFGILFVCLLFIIYALIFGVH